MKFIRISVLFLIFVRIGLGEDFEADVRWTCSDDFVSIFVRTPRPFDGVISTGSRIGGRSDGDLTNDVCRAVGIGTNVAVLKLRLDSDECGVEYDEDKQLYSVVVEVHSHPVLLVRGDKSVNITCRSYNNDTHLTRENDSPISRDFQLRVLHNRLPTQSVRYSQPYTLQVRPLPHHRQHEADFFVGECTAHPIGGNLSVQLTDSTGCALFKSIMGDFSRRDVAEEASIPSMFRFADATQVRISCVISTCAGQCETRSCDIDASASSLLDRTTTSIETDDVQTASITLTIEEESSTSPPTSSPLPKNLIRIGDDATETSQVRSGVECPSQADLDLMYYLCAFLAFCTIIGFTLNIVFCVIISRRKKKILRESAFATSAAISGHRGVPDFWIVDNNKEPTYFDDRRESSTSYASVRKQPRRPNVEYGIPVTSSRSSGTPSEARSNDIYRRGVDPRPEVRTSNSTFLTHSTTMETELDSASSNQTSSYH